MQRVPKAVKWIVVGISLIVAIPVLAFELVYFIQISKINTTAILASSDATALAHDALWISLGERRDDSTSAIWVGNFLDNAKH
jgi:hypothetical protein